MLPKIENPEQIAPPPTHPPSANGTGPDITPPPSRNQFGTFGGVFTPTLLTILGAIMFLREGWVVGNAGLGGTIIIILMANVITITTGLSISSVTTNIRVRAGGAFSIISQSLGLEVGGSVSVPFYFAKAISVAFYVFAFAEGWQGIFPDHPQVLVVLASFAAVALIAFVSAYVAVRVQYVILVIMVAALGSVFLGGLPVAGQTQHEPQLWGSFRDGNFWFLFSIFFPAVTGVGAGVNLSGNLKDPRRSIPRGTMAAVLLSLAIYTGMAVWFAQVATPAELMNNPLVVVEKALYGPAVLAGILAATFSSALTSLVGAPRLLQAIAQHRVLPGGEWMAELTPHGEPRRAMMMTGAVTLVAILFGLLGGGLDAIAPLMTMFFLIAYSVLNLVVLIEQSMGLISFRPLVRIPRFVSLIGLLSCVFAMFLVAPAFSLVALAVIFGLYIFLLHRHLDAPWSDVRSGLFVTVAEWAAKQIRSLPADQERAWKPNLLVPVTSTDMLLGSYRFLRFLAYPRGSVHVIGIHDPDDADDLEGLESATQVFMKEGVFSQAALVEAEDFGRGVRIALDLLHSVFFRPNALFMPLSAEVSEAQLQTILDRTRKNQIGTVLFAQHPRVSLGHEMTVNVWIRDQSPAWEIGMRMTNLDLALLMAYQIARNWHGDIRLITIVGDEREKANGEKFLAQLISLGRMPRGTEAVVQVGTIEEHVAQVPHADLNVFGLQDHINVEFMQRMVDKTRASCIFVRESGMESALA